MITSSSQMNDGTGLAILTHSRWILFLVCWAAQCTPGATAKAGHSGTRTMPTGSAVWFCLRLVRQGKDRTQRGVRHLLSDYLVYVQLWRHLGFRLYNHQLHPTRRQFEPSVIPAQERTSVPGHPTARRRPGAQRLPGPVSHLGRNVWPNREVPAVDHISPARATRELEGRGQLRGESRNAL